MKWFLIFLMFASTPVFAQPYSETGLPIPRFVSLKSSEAFMRVGPGKRYPVRWNYTQRGLPLKIVNEYEHWRQVEDSDGIKGWMHHSMLSGVRTALVKDETVLREKPEDNADPIVRLMPKVVVQLETCRADWCEIEVAEKDGWVPLSLLWGVKLD